MAEINDELLEAVWSTLHQCRCAFEYLAHDDPGGIDPRSFSALGAVREVIELLEEEYGE